MKNLREKSYLDKESVIGGGSANIEGWGGISPDDSGFGGIGGGGGFIGDGGSAGITGDGGTTI